MSTTPRPRSRLIVATLAAALAALLVAGCSGGGSDSGQETTSTTTHTPPKAQQWDPDDAPTTTEPTGPTPAKPVPTNALQPGDVVFPGGGNPQHVAMYIGNGQMIEAPQSGDVVKVSPLSNLGGGIDARRFG